MTDIDQLIATAAGQSADAIEARVALAEEGAAAVPVLARAIRERDPPEDHALSQALLRIHDADAVPALVDLLDDDTTVKSAAYRALGLTDDERAVDPLLQRFSDDDRLPSEQARAARALGTLGDQRAVEPLRQRIEQLRERDELASPSSVAVPTIVALAKLGDHEHAPVLLELLDDDDLMVYLPAAGALKHVVAPGLLDVLEERALDETADPEVRLESLQALFLLGVPESIDTFVQLVGNIDPDIDDHARFYLAGLTDASFDDRPDVGANEAKQWWADHRDDFLQRTCYRLGDPIDVSVFPGMLAPTDPSWYTTLEEVQILSGNHFGVAPDVSIELTESEKEEIQDRVQAWVADEGVDFEDGALYKHGFKQDLDIVYE